MRDAKMQEEMGRIRERLRSELGYNSVELTVWLRSPQALLGNQKAVELVRQGRASEVHRLLDQIRDGVHL